MNIISVSRRTDIPAFYSLWFENRLKAGFTEYLNPFSQKKFKVSLLPIDVSAFVFWSKNFKSFLPLLKKMKSNYRFYCHFTLNDYPTALEKAMPPLAERINTFKTLAEISSPSQVIWRYDPIVLTAKTNKDHHLEKFRTIAKALEGYTLSCYISFVHLYKKTLNNLENDGIKLLEDDLNLKLALTKSLIEAGKQYKINLYACCNDYLLLSGINKGHCIDTEILKLSYSDFTYSAKPAPTRKECGCVKSIDIGKYNSCIHDCSYCYANLNKNLATKTYQEHKTNNTLL